MRSQLKPPTFYYSFRSPYSWLAYRRFSSRYPELLDAVRWIPFWEPEASTRQILTERRVALQYPEMVRAKNFYILQDVRRLADDEGIQVSWPIDSDPWWEPVHLTSLLAQDRGCLHPFMQDAYRARFELGRNLSDLEVVADLGEAQGLERDLVMSLASDPIWQERGVRILADATLDGVFGVPFMMRGPRRYWGLDRLDRFVREQLHTDPAGDRDGAQPQPEATLLEADSLAREDHPGGCG